MSCGNYRVATNNDQIAFGIGFLVLTVHGNQIMLHLLDYRVKNNNINNKSINHYVKKSYHQFLIRTSVLTLRYNIRTFKPICLYHISSRRLKRNKRTTIFRLDLHYRKS